MKGGRSGGRAAATSKKSKKVNPAIGSSVTKDLYPSLKSDAELGFFQKKAARLIRHPKFDIGIGLLIGANAVCLGLETDLEGEPQQIWQVIESIFCCLFVVELILRATALRCRFLRDLWCIFDSLIVSVSVFDITMTLTGGTSSLNILTILRILRLFRLARMVRLVRMFKSLYLVLRGLTGNAQSMMWIGCMLLLITFTFAIFVTRIVGHDEKFKGTEFGELFSTVPVSMFSLFVLMTFDDWYNAFIVPVLLESPFMAFVFILFLMLTAFSILNILCALVVSSTLETAREQMQLDGESDMLKSQQRLLTLQELFSAGTTSNFEGEACMSLKEFDDFVQNPEVIEQLSLLGIHPEDIQRLFPLLDMDGNGVLQLSELVQAVERLCDKAVGKDLAIAQTQLINHIAETEKQFEKEVQAEELRWAQGCNQLNMLEASVETLLEAVHASKGMQEVGGKHRDVTNRLDRLSRNLQRSLQKDNAAIKSIEAPQKEDGTGLSKLPETGTTTNGVNSIEQTAFTSTRAQGPENLDDSLCLPGVHSYTQAESPSGTGEPPCHL